MTVFDNAAMREKEFHPTRLKDGKIITAWVDRAKALNKMNKRLAAVEERIANLEKQGGSLPF